MLVTQARLLDLLLEDPGQHVGTPIPRIMQFPLRAATKARTSKTMVVSGFYGIELGGGSSSMPLVWLPLWQSCLQKKYDAALPLMLVYATSEARHLN